MLNFNTKIRQICGVCKFGVGGQGIDLTNKHAHRVIALTGVHCCVYFIFRECLFHLHQGLCKSSFFQKNPTQLHLDNLFLGRQKYKMLPQSILWLCQDL